MNKQKLVYFYKNSTIFQLLSKTNWASSLASYDRRKPYVIHAKHGMELLARERMESRRTPCIIASPFGRGGTSLRVTERAPLNFVKIYLCFVD